MATPKFPVGTLVVYENYWVRQVKAVTAVKPNVPSGCPSIYDNVSFKYELEGLQTYPGYYENELRLAVEGDVPGHRDEKTLQWVEVE